MNRSRLSRPTGWLLFDPPLVRQTNPGRHSRKGAESKLRCSCNSLSYRFLLETHGRLKKKRIFVMLAIGLIPFISGFHYGAGAKPKIETKGPPSFLGVAKSARIATQVIPAEDQFEVPYKIDIEFGRPICEFRVTAI